MFCCMLIDKQGTPIQANMDVKDADYLNRLLHLRTDRAATILKDVATVAAIDADAHQAIAQEYGIKGFPTIKVFVPGKPPVDYQRAREAKPIAEFALKKAETTEDLNEWKAALEEALPDAPTASQTVGLLRRKDDQSQRPYRGGVAVYQLPNHFECDSCVQLLSIYLMVRLLLTL
ncbi:disulfide isomerase-like protein 2-3 [Tanacetum coccineum]